MVILHLIVGLEAGGAESMLHRLISALPRHKHIIVSLTNIGLIGNRLIDSGHTVYAIDLRLVIFWRSLFKLWRLIKLYRPDVIQTWMYHSDLLGGIIGRFAGVRNIVWNVRNTEIPQRQLSVTGLVVRVCALVSHFIPHKIVCCAHSAKKSHERLGYNRDRMVVIQNGYDSNSWLIPPYSKVDAKRRYKLPLDKIIIGFVGRFDKLKGYDLFIEAAGQLSNRSRQNLLFVLVGRDVVHENIELRKLIDDKGGCAQFRLMGERKDISEIMYAFDIFCLASRAEGFPNVVAEAMLMKVPCVVTDVGDAGLIVGPTGRIVPPNQPAALADELLSISSMSQSQRREIGVNARARVIDQFDINLVAQRYDEVYNWNLPR